MIESTSHTVPYSLEGKKIWIAGHRGMVGSAIARRLARENVEILTVERHACDLRDSPSVIDWLRACRPDVAIIAAATVGGIGANSSYPAKFIYDNLAIELATIHGAWETGVEKLIFLGSSCIYPRLAEQPICEEALLSGALEPTNEWYAIAKIAGIKLCQAYKRQYGANFISLMPTNLYGPGDNFDLHDSHVIPALLRKAHEAKVRGDSSLEVWGSGHALREFLYVDDLADAIIFAARNYADDTPLNIGSGVDIPIRELAEKIMTTVGLKAELVFDASKPDGTPRKLLNVARLFKLGWQPKHNLSEGLSKTYAWFLSSDDRRGIDEMRNH